MEQKESAKVGDDNVAAQAAVEDLLAAAGDKAAVAKMTKVTGRACSGTGFLGCFVARSGMMRLGRTVVLSGRMWKHRLMCTRLRGGCGVQDDVLKAVTNIRHIPPHHPEATTAAGAYRSEYCLISSLVAFHILIT